MELKKIAAAVNFAENEYQACDWAVLIAMASKAELKIINVLEGAIGIDSEEFAERAKLMSEEVARLADRGANVQGEVLIDKGHGTAGTITRWAEEWGSDVIVLGNHPRKGLAKIFDSSAVAQKLVETAHCPIMLTKKD